PVLHDIKGVVKENYKTTGVPETFIIDQNGVIAEKVWGPRDWTQRDSITTIIGLLQNGPAPAQSYKQRP
ncbi:MAG: TlpA family protein disulfide reductase, partial [Deltaproteobacteria bacterium]